MPEWVRIVIEVVLPILTFIGGFFTKSYLEKHITIKNEKRKNIVKGNNNLSINGDYNDGKKKKLY